MDKLKRTVEFINANVEVQGTKLKAEDILVPGFLPNPPIKP